ncbi:MAG TPA: alpha/beta fold hydrolase [Acidimicrobiales bacterium]|nr:alpha/beta fold hydrolase [Acidimicrobiales bacterium]
MLEYPVVGAGEQANSKPRVVLLHGFTQTGASWSSIVPHLRDFAVSTPDLPGHGRASAVRADLWESAEELARAEARPSCWVGYSLGGRTALHVALAHPEQVSGLVLISATAGLVPEEERTARVASDEALASRIEAGGTEGLPGFLAEWLSQPLFATLAPDKAGLAERRSNTPSGLASSLRLCGTGRQQPLWARLAELRQRQLPVLVITGALDQRYCDLGDRLAQGIGTSAERVNVPDAGHACHLEQPGLVGRAIASWVSDHCTPAGGESRTAAARA